MDKFTSISVGDWVKIERNTGTAPHFIDRVVRVTQVLFETAKSGRYLKSTGYRYGSTYHWTKLKATEIISPDKLSIEIATEKDMRDRRRIAIRLMREHTHVRSQNVHLLKLAEYLLFPDTEEVPKLVSALVEVTTIVMDSLDEGNDLTLPVIEALVELFGTDKTDALFNVLTHTVIDSAYIVGAENTEEDDKDELG